MRNLRGTYVHRGDAKRRLDRIRRSALLLAICGAAVVLYQSRKPQDANAQPSAFSFSLRGASDLNDQLAEASGDLALAQAQIDRMNKVFRFSSHYGIGADLAQSIHDIALAEGIAPELAFRLVSIESEFNERAVSPVGAVGLTQLMLPTAKYFQKDVTREQLYKREVNLRIGFRYLRSLIREQDGDVRLALLIYNRGPVAVNAARAKGIDPGNGYDRMVMKGYLGNGIVE